MSSSVFKVYSSSSRDGFDDSATVSGDTSGATDFKEAVHEDLKIDSNLVILLNKNGTVSVDQNTLQSLLANETTSTSVSLVRISSPTPSIEEEIEEEQRRLKDEKSQLDADAASGSSSNEDSNEDSNSMAGASSGTSSIVGSFVSTRRTRTVSKKGSTAVMMEDDDEPRHVSLMVEGFYPPAEAQSFAAQVLSLAGYQHPLRKEAIDIEYIRHTVSNDHCYTPLTSPTQKLPPKAPVVDVDSSEEPSGTSTGGAALTGSTSRTSAAAKIIDRRKSVGVRSASKNTTPPNATKGPPLNRRKSTAVALPSIGQDQKKSNKVTKPSQQGSNEDDNVDDDDDDDEDADEDEDDEPYSDYEEEESSFSEEDDDEMDLDFSVGRRSPIKKRKPLRKGKLPTKTLLRSSTTTPRKVEPKDLAGDRLKEGAKSNTIKVVRNQMGSVKLSTQHQQQIVNRAGGQQVLKPFTGKKPTQKTHTMTSATGSVATPTILNSKVLSSASTTSTVKMQIKPETASTSQPKQAPAVTVVPPVVATPKKEKKPKSNAFDAAMFSDISALFSTPDIIKKVNTSKGPTLTPPATATNNSLISSPPFKTSIEPLVMSVGPKLFSTEQHKTAPLSSNTCKTISHSSGLTEQGLDLINAIVQEDLRQPIEAATVSGCSTTQPVEIPNIVKMLETSAAGVVSAVDSNALISPQLLAAPPPPIEVKALVEPVVGLLATDTSILEALNSGEDALPEDLMEHVAELAKNKELQEILDKQVLGVMGNDALLHGTLPLVDTAALANLVPEQTLEPTPNFSTMELSVPLQLNVPVEPTVSHPMEALPTLTVKEQLAPRKEAIQIRRSDGRVITLPPIEAPATRSSKRRAQGSFGTKLHPSTTTPDNPESYINSSDALSSPGVKSSRPLKPFGVATPLSSRPSTPATSGAELQDESSIGELVMDETLKVKRNSKSEGDNRVRTKRTPAPSSAAAAAAADAPQDDDLDSDESWNSEDDPDRLWCICRQPHNNRFMICCDLCEDWFHGKCVNITKAMGQQMEHDGIEWTCPNCIKKKQDRQQPKMTDFLVSRAGGTSEVAPISSKPESANPQEETAPNGCIVCGNPAKPSSIYCSDDCIRKHAGSIPTVKSDNKAKERTTSVPSSVLSTSLTESSPGSANDTIIVMERKTGRCMTGKNAPTEENIKKWLQDHPTFEVVPPGSAQANIILAKAESRRLALAKEASASKSSSPIATVGSNVPKAQTQMKMNDQKKMILVSSATTSSKVSSPSGSRPAPGTPASKLSLPPKSVSTSSGAKQSNVLTTPGSAQRTGIGATTAAAAGYSVQPKANASTMVTTANSSAATPVSSSVGSNKQKRIPASVPSAGPEHGPKHQISGGKTVTANSGGENIRVTVKKTLKEHLMQRTAELAEDSPIPRLQEEEIDQFVSETEKELFILFKKDTGMKYRAKYRSLVFNIKDRKNLSLFQKISEKSIEPKQLVRMTADELASQELAQWRENETKHQLEMIKKTELESLACAKNYVLKTHKGEEMIEDKRESRVQIDPSVPVDDVVSLLNNSTVSSTSELEESLSANDTGTYRTKEYDYEPYGKHYTGLYGVATTPLISSSNVTSGGAKSDSAGTSAVASSSSSSVSRKKDSRRSSHGSRSRSREHKREHRDRSRDRNRSKHKRKRSRDRSSDRHTSRDRDRHHRGRERSRERSKHEKSSREKDQPKGGSSEKRRASTAVTVPGRTDTEPFDSSSKAAVDAERKDGKLETHSKTLGNVKKSKDEPSNSNSENKMTENVKPSISDNEMLTENKMPPSENADQLPVKVGGAAKSTKMEQDQEPTSTVTIPTPPHHHPYEGESPDEGALPTKAAAATLANEKVREAERSFWTGSVHMVDVASVEMSIRPVSGDVHDIAKDFSVDLDICGTIKPEIVWDYIAQIRKSPNKEVCLVRFHSLETTAYYTLYNHLHTRKRYSVVKAPSTLIKDFYIFPLPAEQTIPLILKPLRGVGIIEGDRKPNLLLGVLVKIKGGKRSAVGSVPATQVKMARRQSKHSIGNSAAGKPSSGEPSASDTVSLMQQVITKYATKPSPALVTSASTSKESKRSDTSDEVPEMDASSSSGRGSAFATHVAGDGKKTSFPTTIAAEKQCGMDVDMEIIKAPIAGKGNSLTVSISSHLSEGNSNSSLGSAASRMTSAEPMLIDEDGDEPYSPGGASDDSNFADVTAIVDNSKQGKTSTMELIQREVYELDRKIAMEQNEIEGLMTMTELQEKETLPPSLINGLPIPANLSQILASIKVGSGSGAVADEEIPSSSGGLTMTEPPHATSERVNLSCLANDDDEEYNPSAPSLYSNYKSAYTSVNSLGDIDERIIPASLVPTIVAPTASVTAFDMMAAATTENPTQCATELGDTVPSSVTMIRESTGTVPLVVASDMNESRLAKLSDEELLSLVPDDAMMPDSSLKE
ncbi:uncharacterized protein LOC128278950 [Anopheles cruzii]|uniref:uncharacterized protein LOC128278950 n=1 Tax=Anopheles cruzii TaxID=68878 RepID=UPI0022EC802C|nr:uncharacterized protein LOC128278950 [Anopheles cruzii]